MPFEVIGEAPKTLKEGCGELRVMQKLNEYEFGVELWIMRNGVNRNNWDYRNIGKHYLSFLGQPILVAYVMEQVGDGHNMRIKRDPATGEKYYSFMDGTAERIVGTLSDNKEDFTLAERDGHTWIVAKGKLFAFYARELVDKIVRTGRMEVSAETMAKEEREENGITVYENWVGIGVTVLGDQVAPAVPGARIAALAAMQDEFKELKLRAASYNPGNANPKNNNSEKGVKRSMNKRAAEALAPKFEGYRIMALSEDGNFVGLIDDHGDAFTYAFNAEDNGEVIKARIKPAYLTAAFHFGENAEESVEVSEIVSHACNSVRKQDESVEELNKQLRTANEKIAAMEESENKRRVNAAKAAVTATLSAFNANRENKIGEDAVKSVVEKIDAGLFTNSVDKDGNWLGEQMVRDAVLAVCGAAVMEEEKLRANAKKRHFIGERFGNDDHGTGEGVMGLLDKWGVETTGAEQ